MRLYAAQLQSALSGAVDTRKLAEAWAAMNPQAVGKALGPARAAFIARARQAIEAALSAVLGRLWPEGWVLGQLAAEAVVAGLESVDWQGWTPGDYAAAEAIAGAELRRLLDESGIRIQSIAESRLEELAAVLEATLASDVTTIEATGPLPPRLSVSDLERQLQDVLDKPQNAELVAWTEIARAQAEAARATYAQMGVAEVRVSTAADDRVCPVCEAAEKVGAHPVGLPPLVPLHPRCRCAEIAVRA